MIHNTIPILYIQQMPKHPKRAQKEDSDDEQVEDVMAWGSRKENYYQQSESEYSELEE